jgi:hypothetical protein
MLRGGCFCGAIRYQAAGTPFNETNCHCSICRRTSGAPFVAWFTVKRSEFRFIAGEPAMLASTPVGLRRFCARCGTPLTFEHRNFPDEIDVTVGSLDDPEAVPPKDHTRTSSRLRWARTPDGLPEFSEGRPD